jgi:hypothetical protein
LGRGVDQYHHHRVVSQKSEERMWRPQQTSDHKETDCGLGFFIEKKNGLKVSHNGAQTGVATRLVRNTGPAAQGTISTAIYFSA